MMSIMQKVQDNVKQRKNNAVRRVHFAERAISTESSSSSLLKTSTDDSAATNASKSDKDAKNRAKERKDKVTRLDAYKKSTLLTPTISSSSKSQKIDVRRRPLSIDWVSERKNGQSRYKVEQKAQTNLQRKNLTRSTPILTERGSHARRPKSALDPIRTSRQKHDDLSRASSISNLTHGGTSQSSTASAHEEHARKKTHGVLTKARKSLSKDRLVDDGPTASSVSDPVEDAQLLQQKLAAMAAENSQLLMQVGEQRGQLALLQKEITRLKMYQEQSNLQIEQLSNENASLRNKLRDVVHSPLSDNEKQQLLLDSQRHHSSAPASIAPNLHSLVLDDQQAQVSSSDWDKQSTSNVSDVSVACLQDKINQMQETHYSTNEELQATLQELTDLQKQLGDVQQDNERLSEEKNLMFDSLCRQTERLNDARDEIESLKQALYNEDNGQYESVVERKEELVDLLKVAQDEREMLLLRQEQLLAEVEEVRADALRRDEDNCVLGERLNTLESTLDAKHAEHRQLDQELTRTKDLASSRMIEIDRLNEILDNARTKIFELEQDRAMSDKSEVEELLDNTRKEKDALEAEIANLKEQVARGKNELEKLREQVSVLQEECKVLRNNAKCTRSELEYKVEILSSEKEVLSQELQKLEEAANELQVQTQCQLEDKRQLSSVLSETQRNMRELERRTIELDAELNETKKIRESEMEEWDKFQNDLLTSVRVANDFKNEAQQELQKFVMENKQHRERIRQLEAQVEKLKANNTTMELAPAVRPSNFPPGDDLSSSRCPNKILSRQSSRQSVKSLIETIENAGKPLNKNNGFSRSSSASSLNSLTSEGRTPSSPLTPLKTPEWLDSGIKTPLKEVPNKQGTNWPKTLINENIGKSDNNKKEESLNNILQTKSLEYSRRNSYSETSDRKDPLNGLVKNGGSKRNALLKWCQNKTVGYRNIDITNFSSSWNDGLGFCAILHTYLPDRVPYDTLKAQEKRRNFSIAFQAAESVGIPTTLNINEMVQQERPDWQQIMGYVTAIYKHFEA